MKKISSVAPLRGAWVRTHHLRDIKRKSPALSGTQTNELEFWVSWSVRSTVELQPLPILLNLVQFFLKLSPCFLAVWTIISSTWSLQGWGLRSLSSWSRGLARVKVEKEAVWPHDVNLVDPNFFHSQSGSSSCCRCWLCATTASSSSTTWRTCSSFTTRPVWEKLRKLRTVLGELH